jgi:L-ribulose-5-phosphate 3-epimerase UlaE
VKLKGCTTIEPGAGVVFRPYRQGTGSRYKVLFETEHCTVMRTNGGTVIEKWRFSNKMTSAEIREARQWENQKLDAFYKSRREETQW